MSRGIISSSELTYSGMIAGTIRIVGRSDLIYVEKKQENIGKIYHLKVKWDHGRKNEKSHQIIIIHFPLSFTESWKDSWATIKLYFIYKADIVENFSLEVLDLSTHYDMKVNDYDETPMFKNMGLIMEITDYFALSDLLIKLIEVARGKIEDRYYMYLGLFLKHIQLKLENG